MILTTFHFLCVRIEELLAMHLCYFWSLLFLSARVDFQIIEHFTVRTLSGLQWSLGADFNPTHRAHIILDSSLPTRGAWAHSLGWVWERKTPVAAPHPFNSMLIWAAWPHQPGGLSHLTRLTSPLCPTRTWLACWFSRRSPSAVTLNSAHSVSSHISCDYSVSRAASVTNWQLLFHKSISIQKNRQPISSPTFRLSA